MVLVRGRSGDVDGIGWTYGPTACATLIKDKLAAIMKHRITMDVEGSFQAMVRALRNAGLAGYAISAVDVALWDLKARMLDLPLHHLLGAVDTRVPVYGSGGFTTYDERQLGHQLGHWALEQRIPRVKIKIGESWCADLGRDLDRMRQARTIIGDDDELFVDANGGYTRKQAIRVMAAAADSDVHCFQETGLHRRPRWPTGGSQRRVSRRHGQRIRLRPLLLPPDVPSGCRRLPPGRPLWCVRCRRVVLARNPSLG